MAATFSTLKGHFNLSTTNTSMVDWDFKDIIDYDDQTRFGLCELVMTEGKSEEVETPEYFCFAGELNPRTGTFNNGTVTIATDTTNIIVTSTDGIRVDDVLHVGTAGADGEHIRVTAIGTDNVTVTRMNTIPATIATDGTFVILGGASSELSTAGITATFMEPEKITSRCQLIRRSFSLSEREDVSSVRVKTRNQQKAEQCRMDFRLDIGHTFWFGISTSSSSGTYTTTKGINEQLAGNAAALKISVGGALGMDDLAAMMEALSTYSKTDKYVTFVGSKALGGLAELGATASIGAQETLSKVYGSAAQTVAVADFRFTFKLERLFDVIGSPYNGYAYFLDWGSIMLNHLKGRKLIVQSNTKIDPLSEITTTQYKTDSGVAITWPKRHGFMHGIT